MSGEQNSEKGMTNTRPVTIDVHFKNYESIFFKSLGLKYIKQNVSVPLLPISLSR